MTKRFLTLVALTALALTVGACRPTTLREPRTPFEFPPNPERRVDLGLVAVLAPLSEAVRPLVHTLRSELKLDYDVYVCPVSSSTGDEELGEWLAAHSPSIVVVVDNPTVARYQSWAQGQDQPPAAIVVMASFAEDLGGALPNSTAIAFEPPAVTVLTDLRRILEAPLSKVGVIHRPGFSPFIAREAERARTERFTLLSVEVPSAPTPRDVARALRKLAAARVDALWVTNDNRLLTADLLSQAWLPFADSVTLPIVVGVPSLVTTEPHFGTYAAVADIEGLGVQTADLIYDLERTNFEVRARRVQPALSIRTYLDVTHARKVGLTDSGELLVDERIEGERR